MSARKKPPATYQKSKKKAVPPKKGSKKTSSIQTIVSNIRANKLIVALILIVVLLIGVLINQKYQDWDNAQMIKGLARDFPALVAEIESATGLDLEVKYDCMKTEEKFTEGVNICEISTGYLGKDGVGKEFIETLEVNNKFTDIKITNSEDYEVEYRNKQVCDGWTAAKDRAYLTCRLAIRNSNINLASELLSK